MQTKTETSGVRWMTAKDMPQVSALAKKYLADLRVTDKDLTDFSRSRNHIPKVIVSSGGRILGFTLYVVKQMSIEIVAICISDQRVREGLGRTLIDELKVTANKLGKEFLSCHIPETNLSAQLFFKSLGFKWVSTVEATTSAQPQWNVPGSLYRMRYSEEVSEREGN